VPWLNDLSSIVPASVTIPTFKSIFLTSSPLFPLSSVPHPASNALTASKDATPKANFFLNINRPPVFYLLTFKQLTYFLIITPLKSAANWFYSLFLCEGITTSLSSSDSLTPSTIFVSSSFWQSQVQISQHLQQRSMQHSKSHSQEQSSQQQRPLTFRTILTVL